MDVHPHCSLISFVTGVPFVEEAKVVANQVAPLSRTHFGRGTRRFDGRAGRDELSKGRRVNVRPVADPTLTMSKVEHVVRVNEPEHSGRMNEEPARHVSWVTQSVH